MLSGARVLRILEVSRDLRRGGSHPCGDTGPQHLRKRQEPLQMVRCKCSHRPAPPTCSTGAPAPSARQERGKLEEAGRWVRSAFRHRQEFQISLQAARGPLPSANGVTLAAALTTEQPQGEKPQTLKFLGNYCKDPSAPSSGQEQ